ncbi:MAG: bifunctional UDP-N-acetylglucosamine diphosphorylase/glucosamine-1-phosphate N-acetyltransferase GlmU, partial [Endozoicomonas sp.]
DQVKTALSHYDLHWVHQDQQLGTGHAVQQALPGCEGADVVLILYGDVPLIESSSLIDLLNASKGSEFGLLTINLANPSGYGRIIRDGSGNILAIVEEKDATPDQQAINEINTGIMAIPGSKIAGWVSSLKNENSQSEFYLTDIVSIATSENISIINTQPDNRIEVTGVNSRIQQMELERALQENLAIDLMINGVTVVDPKRLDIRGEVKVGKDVTLDINVVLEGSVELGDNVYIEPGCIIRNSIIGDGVIIKAHSMLDNAYVAAECEVGPFARLRPGTELQEKAKIGNFVEIKKTIIGKGSKVNHLSYVGDAELGNNVNIGAGTITCNYDGVNKFKTVIEDGAFIGSNSALVAPVTIGRKATSGAGSTITRDIPDKQLGIARGRQCNIDNWQRPLKKH